LHSLTHFVLHFFLVCPLFSTGIFGFDNLDAAHVALRTTREWLESASPAARAQLDAIVFVVFLPKDDMIYRHLLPTYFPVEANALVPLARPTPDPTNRPAPREESGFFRSLRSGPRSRSSSPMNAFASASSSREASPVQQPRASQQPHVHPQGRRGASPSAAAAASPGAARALPAAASSPRTYASVVHSSIKPLSPSQGVKRKNESEAKRPSAQSSSEMKIVAPLALLSHQQAVAPRLLSTKAVLADADRRQRERRQQGQQQEQQQLHANWDVNEDGDVADGAKRQKQY
jgi:hypothetical protein